MKTLFYLVLCFVAVGSLSARAPYPTRCERVFNPRKQTAVQLQVRAYMDTVVFPRVSLSHVPFSDAVSWVQQHISEHAPSSVPVDRRGIGIFLKQRQGVREFVSISLRTATLPQVFDAICKPHQYVWSVEPMALSVTPREQKPPVIRPRPSA